MRRGEEHLDLSKRRGRGMRIMQNCLNLASHRIVSDEEQSHATDGDTGDAATTKAPTGAASPSSPAQDAASPSSARSAAGASRASLPKITSASKSARTPRRGSQS